MTTAEHNTTNDYKAVIAELHRRAHDEDDLFASQCIAVISLILAGWRCGDDTPVDVVNDDVIDPQFANEPAVQALYALTA